MNVKTLLLAVTAAAALLGAAIVGVPSSGDQTSQLHFVDPHAN